MVALLTLDTAKQSLRVTVDDDDVLIARQIEQASAICLNYIKKTIGTLDPDDPSIVDWTDATVPDDVQAAVEHMLYKLYDGRTASEVNNNVAMGYLPITVTALLHRWRDPALA